MAYDMPYPKDMAIEAAFNGRLQFLQWLRERRCPWQDTKILIHAAASGSVAMLAWLQSVTAPWSDTTKLVLLYEAAVYDELDLAKWLRETAKAPWPDNLRAATIIEDAPDLLLSERVQRWALTSSDCSWEGWDCKALAAKQHETEDDKRLFAELFSLAHQHRCPCTCTAAN
jgi:hypothetical protein